jgi:hypothetical protein
MNPDPEYYNRDVKRLKAKVRKRYNHSKYSQNHQTELKLLYKELLLTKRGLKRLFLRSALQNEGRSWAKFYKYVKRRRGTKGNIPAIKDHNGKLITEPADKANTLKSYYASIFSCKRNITVIRTTDAEIPFTININTIRKRLSSIGRIKTAGPDGIPGEILL